MADYQSIKVFHCDYAILKKIAKNKDDMKLCALFNKMMKKCFPKEYRKEEIKD